MAEAEEKFSDFQQDECIVERQSFVEKQICPTCTKNPNYVLEKRWFKMTEGWLDEATCQYKIVINELEVSGEQPGGIIFPADDRLEQEIIREGIRRLLSQYDKLIADETVCSFGGCSATKKEIQDLRADIEEYKTKAEKFKSAKIAGVLLGTAFAGVPGGIAGLALTGLVTKGLLDKDRFERFGLFPSENEQGQLKEYLTTYFGSDLSSRLEKIENLYPMVHPYALEWVTVIEETYVNYRYNEGKKYLISIPAENFNKIPEAPIGVSDITEDLAFNLDEIVLDTQSLSDRLFKLRVALNAFSFYYSAFQRVDDLLIRAEQPIVGEDPSLNRLNYAQVISEITEFKALLNDVLAQNGFERLFLFNVPTFGIRTEAEKIKIVFDTTDEIPFNIAKKNNKYQVYAKSGCKEYVRLNGSFVLNKYPTVLAFLARLDEITIDLTALETKPWLEFTLEYFYPTMIADYGLNSGAATEEQKSALACFLEQELALGDGNLIDSVTETILSAADIWAYERAKEACKQREAAVEDGASAEKDKKNRKERKAERAAERRAEMVDRFTNDIYNEEIQIIVDNFNYIELTADEDHVPWTRQRFENRYPETVESTREIAKQEAEEKYAANEEKFGDKITNSPWAHDTKDALRATFEKEFTIVDTLKKDINTLKDVEGLNDFLAVFGVCGVSKLSGTVIKCLTGGLTLEKILDAAIRKIFEYMDLYVFQAFLNGLPANIKREIDRQIQKQFGKGLGVAKLLGFLLEQQPNANLRAVSGPMLAEIDRAMDVIRKSVLPADDLSPQNLEEVAYLLEGGDTTFGIWALKLEVDKVYDYDAKSFKGENDKDKKRNERLLRRNIRSAIKDRDKEELEAARKKFLSLLNQPALLEGSTLQEDAAEKRAVRAEGREQRRGAGVDLVNTKIGALGKSEYEQAVQDYEETNLGVKVNKLIGAVLVEAIESLFDFIPSTNLFEMLKQFPIPDLVINLLETLIKPCPSQTLFYPPPAEFLNSLKVDICDPTLQISFPKLVMPPTNWRYSLRKKVRDEVRKKLQELFTKLLVDMLKKILDSLESAFCKALETIGGFVAESLGSKNLEDSFYKALDAAFCGADPGYENARAISDSLFGLHAAKATNLISGLAAQDELLNAITSDEPDDELNDRIANAINTLAPELEVLLGSPDKVGYFFQKVGSFLSPEDKERIQDMLDEGIPNLPISSAICLTNEQLDEWNKLREQLLRDKGLSPEDALAQVNRLNDLTEEALADFMDDLAALDGPGLFTAPVVNLFEPTDENGYPVDNNCGKLAEDAGIDDIYDNDEECCDDVIQNQQSEFEKDQERTNTEEEFEALNRIIKQSFLGRGGIFNEALRDMNDKTLFFHILRVKRTHLWSNYANHPDEHEIKYADAGKILQATMKLTSEGAGKPDPEGIFPETVCIKLRDEASKEDNFEIKSSAEFSMEEIKSEPYSPGFRIDEILTKETVSKNDGNKKHNIFLRFVNDQKDNKDIKPKRNRVYYESYSNITYLSVNPGYFDYYSSVTENISKDDPSYEADYSSIIPIELSDEQVGVLSAININYGVDKENNMRQYVFDKFLNYNYSDLIGSQDYKSLFDSTIEEFTKSVKDSVFIDPDNDIPYGFRFGYKPDSLIEDDFVYYNPDGKAEYNLRNAEKKLGVYNNSRIVVLDPEVYGGTYRRPPIHIKPLTYTGWLDTSQVLFGGYEGCEPKTPGALTFKDIGQRVNKLKNGLQEDSRLAEDPDCISIRPFNHLLHSKTHASLDGVVRTTLRTYAAEYFLLGLGIFTNLKFSENNYDLACTTYMVNKMKETMTGLGSARSSRRIRIKRSNYWYTFLEQAVQAYQRMIDVDGLKPPIEIQSALDIIYQVQKNYVYPTRKLKRKFLNVDYTFRCPGAEMHPDDITDISYFYHAAAAFRIYGDNMFKAEDEVKIRRKKRFRLKKLRFFTKILAIRIVERECILILSEMMKSEIRILSDRFSGEMSVAPTISDAKKYLLGMEKIFPMSSSRIGLASHENGGDPGNIPSVSENNMSFDVPDASKATFIVEKYIRLREGPPSKIQLDGSYKPVPDFILNRLDEYRGIISPEKFNEFKASLSQEGLGDFRLSDCFGDLEFVYKKNIKSFYEKKSTSKRAFINDRMLQEFITLNPDLEKEIVGFHHQYLLGRNPPGFTILISKKNLDVNEELSPAGVVGDTGVYYGIRISIIPPKGKYNIDSTSELTRKSKASKALMFNDGNLILPLVSEEILVIDQNLDTFDPLKSYDLACMVSKVQANPIYTLMFDKVFSTSMISSMAAIYCMHNWPFALGFGTSDDPTEFIERDIDAIDPADPEDENDGVYNKKAKRMLRRQFAGLYLSNDSDGLHPDREDSDGRLEVDNPFDEMSLANLIPKIPLLQRRRIIANPYDANGEECTNPLKDLF